MQKLIQSESQQTVETEYSFEEICPEWSNILAQNGGFIENRNSRFEADDGKTRTIMECSSCLVGEAHG